MKKMLVTINDPPYAILRQMARRKGITVQMMLRSIVIPQWLEERTGQIVSEELPPNFLATDNSERQKPIQAV
jgi:hypothetical protein